MPTFEARYTLAVCDEKGAFLGFVPGPRAGIVQLPAEAVKFSLPADAMLAAAEFGIRYPGSVEPWDLLLQRPIEGKADARPGGTEG